MRYPQAGTYIFKCKATDNDGMIAERSTTVNVYASESVFSCKTTYVSVPMNYYSV